MSKRLKRKFHIPDADFIQEAKNKANFFKKDKPDFINFDVAFSDPFYDSVILMIKDVENTDDDHSLKAQQTQLSAAVDQNMQRCRDKFNDSKHFIEKAFPDQPVVWDAFGYKRYDKARKNKVMLIQFMKTFHSFAMKYSSELIAVNYTQPMIDEIETLQKALDDATLDHHEFKKSRSTEQNNRIIKMNDLYFLIMQVCKAGKRIYKNDRAMYQRYLFKHFKKERKKKLKAAA